MLSKSEAALFESLYKQTRQRFHSNSTDYPWLVKIEGLLESPSEEASRELKLAIAIGLASPLPSAKARLLLILHNLSLISQKLLIDLEAAWVIEKPSYQKQLKQLEKYEEEEGVRLPGIVTLGFLSGQDPTRKLLKDDYVPLLKKGSKDFLAANKAITECNRCLKSSPNDLECLHVLGILYTLVGKFTEDSNVEERIEQTLLLIEAGLIKQPSSFQKKMPSDGCRLEEKSAQLLSAMGFRTLNTKSTADGGIDIYAFSDEPVISGKYIVQCKDWSKPVGEPVLRDLYGLIIAEAANKGIVIATSGFTAAATNFAQNKQLELIDGAQFEALLRQFNIP